jgi:alkanesulfonate monooxygenase SsuD/methylene tetrahydromethanopterin reductase-like flavin-dependent oxidoreductase (luciferase family)
MQFGLVLPNAGECGDARTLAELAALAEASGWDAIFLEDYITHHSDPHALTYDPWVALAAMAMRTERIRLGTSVTPLSRRRPWKLARETVTLDHLSNGRLILGVGLGDLNDPGFGQVGEVTENKERAAILDEALDILVRLWSGEPVTFTGKHFQVRDLTLLPRPVQQPRIPIWVGGNWPHKGPMRRAARWDGFCGGKEHAEEEPWLLTPDEVRKMKATIASYRTSDAPFELALGGAERSDDPEAERAAIKGLAEAGATWWIEYIAGGNLDHVRAGIARGPLRF